MGFRHCRAAGFALAGVLASGSLAEAQQDYPNRTIRVIVGPSSDVTARLLADRLHKPLGQAMVIENRGGGGGEVAAKAVSASEADGYTLLYATSSFTLNTALQNASYNFAKVFNPVSLFGISSFTLLVHPSVPAKNLRELIALAKEKPGTLNCASSGIGTPAHLGCEVFNAMAGIRTVHVPFRDVNAAVNALVSGYVQMTFAVSANAYPQVVSGTLRPIAMTTAKRTTILPDVPTLMEQGLDGFVITGWGSFVAPAGTPKFAIERLNTEIQKQLLDPEVKKIVEERGGMEDAGVRTPEQFRDFIRDDTARWNRMIDLAGVPRGKVQPR